ncbi:DUF4197 domain-containing protein [uncultured Desulfuromonas sp.]|uniref:DUF4197 domain-containing protein n=1 Tax=uncultured Desulfuromonas sp. TaxID=181013 RepID=UPI002AAB41B6|nr:DUF4197 domain-containing protein [uncultured Desulfuromonas sp.]
MKRNYWFAAAITVMISLCTGCVEVAQSPLLGSLLTSTTTASALDESTVASGLKEALRVGSERAVSLTSTEDGFLGNSLIRIAMPESLQKVSTTLRRVGMGSYVDEFEVAMNRAAESASGEAKGVFWEAITSMTLTDAMGILQGDNTAATDYFRDKTSAQLSDKFKPIVQDKMAEVGVYGYYTTLVNAYNALPFTSKPQFDLEQYIVDEAQDGVFTMLAIEEVKIRQDPAKRTTELLKKVFAAQD